jgi:hypothetical protein
MAFIRPGVCRAAPSGAMLRSNNPVKESRQRRDYTPPVQPSCRYTHLSRQVPLRATAMSRLLLTSCLCLFATAALAVPPVDKCNKISTPASPSVAQSRGGIPNTPSATAPTATPVSTADINNHHSGSGATSTTHAAQPRIISPRWHSLLPGMFR